jgi:prepilin-type N-terminal cleavage/methylation domain-containing protein
MKHRPGVTLVEVLVTIFIMGIGMLALLVLFPLGALTMAQALRDDRTATASASAAATAINFEIRQDLLVAGQPNTNFLSAYTKPFGANSPYVLPDNWAGPGWPVYVDPYYAQLSAGPLGAAGNTPGIPRRSLSFSNAFPGRTQSLTAQETARWFTLLDDITFAPDGTPDLSAGIVDRPGRYTWAYLLRRPRAASPVTELTIVVYSGRNLTLQQGETTYMASGNQGETSVTLTWDPAVQPKPALRTGGWILDTTFNPSTNVVNAYFYRVVAINEVPINATVAPATMVLELQNPLKANVNAAVAMEFVVDVFDKGTGWLP